MIKTIEITPPGLIPPDKLQQYNALKARYTELTEQETRSDSDREEMASLISRAQELMKTSPLQTTLGYY